MTYENKKIRIKNIKMIKFKKKANTLILEYVGVDELQWVFEKFKNNESITLNKTFHLTKKKLIEKFDSSDITNLDCQFEFGILKPRNLLRGQL